MNLTQKATRISKKMFGIACLCIFMNGNKIDPDPPFRLIANLFTEKCVNFQRLFIATHR